MTPVHEHPALVTILIAFTASIQWVAFDKINGRAYTNLFTTGNLKGVATNLYDYCISKEKADFDRFFHYLSVVLAFIAGAIVLVFCHHLFGAFDFDRFHFIFDHGPHSDISFMAILSYESVHYLISMNQKN